MNGSPSDGARIAKTCGDTTDRLVEQLRGLSDGDLLGPSALPRWSRLTVVCHLRYGATACRRMTEDALAVRPASYYPGGRARQRPSTLEPGDGEQPADVVASLAAESGLLAKVWAEVPGVGWAAAITEPPDNPDLGAIDLATLALLRLTEVEVHGTDLDVGLGPWSDEFVAAALPLRLSRLARQHIGGPGSRHSPTGRWLLRATDGRSHMVAVAAGDAAVEVTAAEPRTDADAVIEGTGADILALLLGRTARAAVRYEGDEALAAGFGDAFPGP